jgi:hypothetical protein
MIDHFFRSMALAQSAGSSAPTRGHHSGLIVLQPTILQFRTFQVCPKDARVRCAD